MGRRLYQCWSTKAITMAYRPARPGYCQNEMSRCSAEPLIYSSLANCWLCGYCISSYPISERCSSCRNPAGLFDSVDQRWYCGFHGKPCYGTIYSQRAGCELTVRRCMEVATTMHPRGVMLCETHMKKAAEYMNEPIGQDPETMSSEMLRLFAEELCEQEVIAASLQDRSAQLQMLDSEETPRLSVGQSRNTVCPICFEENLQLCQVVPCRHEFCVDCIRQHTSTPNMRSHFCPLCRGYIL
jgi:hypothetical protein